MTSARSWESALPRLSLNRRVGVLVLVLTTIVVGAVAAVGIPLELIPRGFEPERLNVRAPWRDAPPQEVLDKVVLPLEEELSTVGGLAQMSSWSSRSTGNVYMTFKQGTDMDIAYREVRDRIVRVKPRLPDDLERVLIRKHDDSNMPIMAIGIATDQRVTDPYNLIQKEIIAPLQRVEGVAAVRSDGLQEKEILVELDSEKTSAAGLNIYDIGQTLAADNFTMASGAIQHGSRKLLLRSISRYVDIDEFANQLVAPEVRLSDVANVRYALPERDWRVRVNSKPALAIQVLKEGPANIIDLGARLTEVFEEIKANPRLAGSDVGIIFNQADIIKESLSTLVDSGQVGALLAAFVLFFFLRRLRMTLIIALAIPLSMLVALSVMYFAGETLNILSLLGLIISVGLLVDNSVVVAENIHRLSAEGCNARDSCIRGTAEIALAVVLATLTTIIVFLPASLVDGQIQFFLLRLAIPITVSLVGSLLVALVVVPLFVYATLSRKDGRVHPVRSLEPRWRSLVDSVVGNLYRHTMDRLGRVYVRLLGFFLVRRFDLVLLIGVAWALTFGAFMRIDIVDVSREERRSFDVDVDLPEGFSLEDAEEFFASIEPTLADLREELSLEGYLIFHDSSRGSVEGWLSTDTPGTAIAVTERVMKALPKRPGLEYSTREKSRSEDDESSDKKFEVLLTGEDPVQVSGVGESLEGVLASIEGVVGVRRSRDLSPNELALVLDRERVYKQQINPQIVAGVVSYALRGRPLPRHRQDGREIPVRLRFDEEDRDSLAELKNFEVPSQDGTRTQIAAISDVNHLHATNGIFRRDKRISYSVTLDLEEKGTDETRERLRDVIAAYDLPEGIRMGGVGSLRSADEDVASMKFAALVSVLFIYMLMGFLFESFLLPLSIIFTIPLAIIGVVWMHAALDRDIDMLGMVGVILLIGVVVNNGIVLIDYVTRLRQAGHRSREALLLAAERRFRPIMMTAATTVVGMVPLTLGAPTSIGLSYRSFGLTLIGGMATATLLTLLIVPVFYTLFEDLRDGVLRVLHKATTNRHSKQPDS